MPSSTLASTTAEPATLAFRWPRLRQVLAAWRRFQRHRTAVVGLGLLVGLLTLALAAPLLTPHDPVRQRLSAVLKPVSAEHPLGTDHLGRDMLARLL